MDSHHGDAGFLWNCPCSHCWGKREEVFKERRRLEHEKRMETYVHPYRCECSVCRPEHGDW